MLPFIKMRYLTLAGMLYFCCMRYIILTITAVISLTMATAQEKWSLQKCIVFGIQHNFSVRQAAIQTGYTDLQLKQDKLAQYPSLNLNNNNGMSFGRRENPTTGIFEDQKFFNTGLNMQSSATIFNWFSKQNIIAADKLEVMASMAAVEKNKNDASLLIAANYLQVLLNIEQAKIVNVQLQQSKAQLLNTQKLVKAGSLPELNAAELEAQVARDSANYISAKGTIEQSLLNLKSTLNLDAGEPFEIETPSVEKIPIDDIATLQPAAVYNLAIANLPQQQYNKYKYQAGEKNRNAAWGAMKPTVSAFGGLSTNYIYYKTAIPERVAAGTFTNTGLIVNTNNGPLNVVQPDFTLTGNKAGYATPSHFFKQFNANFGQNIGIGISVPIFNGGALKSNFERSKLNLKNLELVMQQDNLKLKQDIYQAYNNATVALEKYTASKKTVAASERSFSFAQKRSAVGMLSNFDLLTIQNNLFKANLENALNQFDYVFKMKVLEFYKGQGLKL
jgi:outer membrane protein